MRQEGVVGRKKRRFRKRRTRTIRTRSPNYSNAGSDVELPNTAWVTDVSYVWTFEGWLYLHAILDLFSRRVVGWAAHEQRPRTCADALDRAMTRDPCVGLIHHSDRGTVYASADYGDALTKLGAVKA